MNPLYFTDIAEFSSYLSLQAKRKSFTYKQLKKLSGTVNSELFQKANAKEKTVCQKRMKDLIIILREKAKGMPSNKESSKIHLIATAQLLDEACK